jgi:RNA polymerase sigma-70 factor (ECF subfamily)
MTMPPLPLDAQTGVAHTVGLLVLTLSGNQVCALTRFDAGTLPRFGLPLKIPD